MAVSDAVEGAARVIDELSPGMSAEWSYSGAGGVTLAFTPRGVEGAADGYVLYQGCTWPLQPAAPAPGSLYFLSLAGGLVSVTPVV